MATATDVAIEGNRLLTAVPGSRTLLTQIELCAAQKVRQGHTFRRLEK